MTLQQELEYWRNQTQRLRRRQRDIQSGNGPSVPRARDNHLSYAAYVSPETITTAPSSDGADAQIER